MTKKEWLEDLKFFGGESYRSAVEDDLKLVEQVDRKFDPKLADLKVTLHRAELALHVYVKGRLEK